MRIQNGLQPNQQWGTGIKILLWGRERRKEMRGGGMQGRKERRRDKRNRIDRKKKKK
jgi:hypothetical protein